MNADHLDAAGPARIRARMLPRHARRAAAAAQRPYTSIAPSGNVGEPLAVKSEPPGAVENQACATQAPSEMPGSTAPSATPARPAPAGCPYRHHALRVLSDGYRHGDDVISWARKIAAAGVEPFDTLQESGDLGRLTPAERAAIIRPHTLMGAA